MMMRMIGRIPAMSAAKQMRPEGPAVKVNPAIRIATATGRRSSRRDGAFDRAPGQQHAEGNDRFGAQSDVERKPECEEDKRAGPEGESISANGGAQPRRNLPADDEPGDDACQQSRQTDPGACGADVGQESEDVVIRRSERGFGDREPPEVVGHVARLLGGSCHRELVAVVGGW